MKRPFVLKQDNPEPIILAEATVPLTDRSYLFGDSIYEVISTHNGQPFFIEDHLERLYASAEGIYMTLPWPMDWFTRQIHHGLDLALEDLRAANDATAPPSETYVRIIVSRGVSDFNIDVADAGEPQVHFIFKEAPQYTGRFREEGFYLRVASTRRNAPQALNPAFKTGNYLNNVMGLREATHAGADDALFLDVHGAVTEASTSNFFMVKDHTIITAPMNVGILGGITRKHLLTVAQELGIPVEERAFDLDELWTAEECFVSSSLKGAMPVYRIDDHTFPVGYGPITRRLDTAYWKHVEAHIAKQAAEVNA